MVSARELPRNAESGASHVLRPGGTLGRVRRLPSSLRTPLLAALIGLCLVGAGGCKHRRNKQASTLSELAPPKDAEPWESRYAVAFDDSYTPTELNMQGRAPNDVEDQRLFQARLGYANIVLLVRVEQVWGKGRYQGRQDQFLEVEVGETLLGSLPKNAPEHLMIEVDSIDELPGSLKDEIMLLFLRWDVESEPPFHHHLMPADEDLVALINAMVQHAQDEGVLNAKGDEAKNGKGKRKHKRKGKRKADAGDSTDTAASGPDASGRGASESDDAGVAAPVGGGVEAPDEPPPDAGPQPDESTGLQDLGNDGE